MIRKNKLVNDICHICRFTLIELLMVISIIAILASILLPVLKQVKDQSKKIACSNHLKQIASGLFMYSDDFAGMLPPHGEVFDSNNVWQEYVAINYLNIPRSSLGVWNLRSNIMKCPADQNPTSLHGLMSSYGMNYWITSSKTNKKLSQMTTPGQTLLAGDCYSGKYLIVGPLNVSVSRITCRHPENKAGIFVYSEGHISPKKIEDIGDYNATSVFWEGYL